MIWIMFELTDPGNLQSRMKCIGGYHRSHDYHKVITSGPKFLVRESCYAKKTLEQNSCCLMSIPRLPTMLSYQAI